MLLNIMQLLKQFVCQGTLTLQTVTLEYSWIWVSVIFTESEEIQGPVFLDMT